MLTLSLRASRRRSVAPSTNQPGFVISSKRATTQRGEATLGFRRGYSSIHAAALSTHISTLDLQGRQILGLFTPVLGPRYRVDRPVDCRALARLSNGARALASLTSMVRGSGVALRAAVVRRR